MTPQPNNPTRFTVSVVVCWNRTFTPTGERAVAVASFFDQTAIPGSPTPVALGGGSILLSARTINDTAADVTANSVANIAIKENEWVALCKPGRAVPLVPRRPVGDPDPQLPNQQYLTLIGPDSDPGAGRPTSGRGSKRVGRLHDYDRSGHRSDVELIIKGKPPPSVKKGNCNEGIKNSNRRGVLLLVVLALLAMFAMVAVAFVVLTGAEKTTADRVRTIDAVVDPPDKTLNQAFDVVVRGTPVDPTDATAAHLRHHLKACWRRSTASRRSAP